MRHKNKTDFASASRANPEIINNQVTIFKSDDKINHIANSVPNILLILNHQRQIIFANKNFLQLLQLTEISEIIGKRTGEALRCLHSTGNGGCGTTTYCSKCGAVNAILESHKNKQSVKECRIMTRENEALDFQVIASPYFHDKEMYTLFSFSDISDEKRRQVLERIFFHDILNTAGGIYGLTDVIQYVDDEKELEEMLKMIHTSSETLVDEIKSQRQLSSAEQGNLVLEYSDLKSFEILKELSELYSQHQIIERRKINIDQSDANVNFSSDKTILKRVLGNMLKNALEASTTDGTVTVKSNKNSDKVLFSVHNSTYMEQDVQLQIFKRSYSTKGSGRGLGTYSIKLLGEKFLKGKVWFESEIEKGTTFYFEIPLTLPDS